jgi:hypothetical protein
MLNLMIKLSSVPFKNFFKGTEFYTCYISCNDVMTTELQLSNCELEEMLNINIMAQAYHTSNNSRQMLTAVFQKEFYCAGRVNYIAMS